MESNGKFFLGDEAEIRRKRRLQGIRELMRAASSFLVTLGRGVPALVGRGRRHSECFLFEGRLNANA
jgi:hypothetical protein